MLVGLQVSLVGSSELPARGNRTVSGVRVRHRIMPAVTELRRPQASTATGHHEAVPLAVMSREVVPTFVGESL